MDISQEPFWMEMYRKMPHANPTTWIKHRALIHRSYRENAFSVGTVFGEKTHIRQQTMEKFWVATEMAERSFHRGFLSALLMAERGQS